MDLELRQELDQIKEQLETVNEKLEEIVERLLNLSLPGSNYSVDEY